MSCKSSNRHRTHRALGLLVHHFSFPSNVNPERSSSIYQNIVIDIFDVYYYMPPDAIVNKKNSINTLQRAPNEVQSNLIDTIKSDELVVLFLFSLITIYNVFYR